MGTVSFDRLVALRIDTHKNLFFDLLIDFLRRTPNLEKLDFRDEHFVGYDLDKFGVRQCVHWHQLDSLEVHRTRAYDSEPLLDLASMLSRGTFERIKRLKVRSLDECFELAPCEDPEDAERRPRSISIEHNLLPNLTEIDLDEDFSGYDYAVPDHLKAKLESFARLEKLTFYWERPQSLPEILSLAPATLREVRFSSEPLDPLEWPHPNRMLRLLQGKSLKRIDISFKEPWRDLDSIDDIVDARARNRIMVQELRKRKINIKTDMPRTYLSDYEPVFPEMDMLMDDDEEETLSELWSGDGNSED